MHPFVRDKTFWRLVGDALVLGLVAGVLALVFFSVVGFGTGLWWPDDPDYSFLGGEPWWILVTTATGLSVGTLRLVTHVTGTPTGALAEVQTARVDYRTAPQLVLISAISLIGGSSLGPFDAGVRAGGAAAEWWSARRRLPEDWRSINALSGIAGGVGALVTAPFAAALLNMELAKVDRKDLVRRFVPNVIAASMGFAVFYATIGSTFLDVYAVGPYELKAWHLAAAIPLGAGAALVMVLLMMATKTINALLGRVHLHSVLLATLGGLFFGMAGVLLPLTMFSGKDQLADALDEIAALGAGLLIAVILVKILTFAVSMSTGFVGGPVMPSLFLGGICGITVHVLIPDLPLALTLSTMLVAVPGAVVKAPFTMMVLAAIMVSLGPITVAPAGIAVITAYLLTAGLESFGPSHSSDGVAGPGPDGAA